MNIRKHIPNSITMLNLFAGSMGVYFAFQGNYPAAFFAILIAAVFDFLDGFAARLLKAYSPMGKELDSLADVISFGMAPGAIVFSLMEQSAWPEWLRFIGFLIPVFSALRLAKFNIDENQSSSFIGLPTPANAIFWGGLAYSFSYELILNPWITLVLCLLFSALLVAPLPMFALKLKSLKWSQNKMQYLFLMGSIALLVIMGLDAFAPIIALYIVAAILLPRLLK